MDLLARHSVALNRFILVAAATLFSAIAVRYVTDPVGAVAPHQFTLGSNEAMTVMRVSGAVFLAIALALLASLAQSRLLAGVALLAIVAVVLLAARLLGLAMDGPAPFTLQVLKPEIALAVLSGFGLLVESRRRHRRDPGEMAMVGVS
jgi:hypothetical protein